MTFRKATEEEIRLGIQIRADIRRMFVRDDLPFDPRAIFATPEAARLLRAGPDIPPVHVVPPMNRKQRRAKR